MPLSEDEQRILRQIEQELEQDPSFSERGVAVSRPSGGADEGARLDAAASAVVPSGEEQVERTVCVGIGGVVHLSALHRLGGHQID